MLGFDMSFSSLKNAGKKFMFIYKASQVASGVSFFCYSCLLSADVAYLLLRVQVLKETLLRHGFTFESDTDTEVIPKLAKYVFDKANEGEGISSFRVRLYGHVQLTAIFIACLYDCFICS